MTPLTEILLRQIDRLGPLSIADFMTQALYHPDHGYYRTAQPLGAQGDFTTAPEISQMFGELIGLCLAQSWLDQGAPAPFVLAELGPGSGQLMVDVVRATARVPGFLQAAQITLVEVNPTLRDTQAVQLRGTDVSWVDGVTDLPDGPLFLIANEFFDCLPIRQFERRTDWVERVVARQGDALTFGVRAAPEIAPHLPDAAEGSVLEVRPAANAIVAEIARRVAQGGTALIVDYGDDGAQADTLQAVRAHEKVDPLSDPGRVDLTAHVDFAALRTAAEPFCAVSQTTPQGAFLVALGIQARAQALAQGLSGAARDQHLGALERLTAPDQMGQLFKVLALAPRGAPLPVGVS